MTDGWDVGDSEERTIIDPNLWPKCSDDVLRELGWE
ncbi:MAG: hypothetical protein CM1200mP14_17580 [Gammaproteobacteria bacterium]|nr:MAG: hypothetical protein CM1200mP14_17580 [Gammaproteobacteria bacterium]